jgi:hypothetical protein
VKAKKRVLIEIAQAAERFVACENDVNHDLLVDALTAGTMLKAYEQNLDHTQSMVPGLLMSMVSSFRREQKRDVIKSLLFS